MPAGLEANFPRRHECEIMLSPVEKSPGVPESTEPYCKMLSVCDFLTQQVVTWIDHHMGEFFIHTDGLKLFWQTVGLSRMPAFGVSDCSLP